MFNLLKLIRNIILKFQFSNIIIGRIWWILPNYLRLRLPINSIGYGFMPPFKLMKWVLDPRELISQKYFSFGFRKYENLTQKALFKEIQNTKTKSGIHFLNIGANTGLYALLVGKRFPGVKISLFEPVPINVKFLRKNMQLNKLNPYIYELAAGSYNGSTRIYLDEKLFGMASLNQLSPSSVEVKITKIDDQISEAVDVVLIDVEGHELEVLKGMKKLLSSHSPILIVETSEDCLNEVSKYLANFGYKTPRWLGQKLKFGPHEKNFLYKKSTD